MKKINDMNKSEIYHEIKLTHQRIDQLNKAMHQEVIKLKILNNRLAVVAPLRKIRTN